MLRQFNKINIKMITFAASFAMLGIAALVAEFFMASDLATNTYATNDGVSTQADDGNYITLSASDITLDLIPTADAAATSTRTTVSVAASGTGAVGVYVSMDGNSNSLYLNGESSSSQAITAVSSTTTLDQLPANTWGYSVDGVNYSAVPTASSSPELLGTTSTLTGTGAVEVFYGASVDTSLPGGEYSGTVKYSARVLPSGINYRYYGFSVRCVASS